MSNVMGILSKAAASKPKNKKTELPIVELDPKFETSFEKWLKYKKVEVTTVALKKKEESKLKPAAIEARKRWCLNQKKHQKSIKIKSGKSELIVAAFQQKYSEISVEHQEKLEEIFGDDYNRCFSLNTKVSLTEEAMKQVEEAAKKEEPSVLNKIMDAVGGSEEFLKLFNVEQSIKPTDALDKERMANEETAKMAQKAIDEGILKPQAPSFSVG